MSLSERLRRLLADAVERVVGSKVDLHLERPQDQKFGDFASNVAMTLAASLKKSPRDVAQQILQELSDPQELIEQASVAGPGFINFRIKSVHWIRALVEIAQQAERFGQSRLFTGKKALVEFVSANPTGPLHIGHGRNAVVGDGLARLLQAVGYKVTREYYVNDGGIQMRTLGRSVLVRYQQLNGRDVPFPEDAYQGEYIKDLARDRLKHAADFSELSDQELIELFGRWAGEQIQSEIDRDLADIRVVFDNYFFESTLYQQDAVNQVISELRKRGAVYDADGATWLKSTCHRDDKDRVLIKQDGSYTYLAPDIAYHAQKFNRAYDLYVNLWGADHGGYVPRLRAALHGLGLDETKLHVLLIQMVRLIRGGQEVSMSTRQATYETLENIVKEVGPDVARYFYLSRSHQAQLDFDIELAKQESSENPAYYLQYAHARICSIFAKWKGEDGAVDELIPFDEVFVAHLTLDEELALARYILSYPEVIEKAAAELAPHRIAHYALDLARLFQSYYDRARQDPRYRILEQDEKTRLAKLFLLSSIRQVLKNSLTVLGIEAPRRM